ncbi:Hypothetical protein OINT_2001170 [Brucella intermedia LMG 3301]|uniref:Uncharacterized protein n=1 Tax=Brucella intermedia LMG 3301 TaxID=641118 RepID=C4WNL7_9HYPH|nr:Hypothetical protein OINT_2001170 [Brucella intermedia LMG 3301]
MWFSFSGGICRWMDELAAHKCISNKSHEMLFTGLCVPIRN